METKSCEIGKELEENSLRNKKTYSYHKKIFSYFLALAL